MELVAQLKPNLDGIVIGWSSSKMVSGSCALPPQCSCVVIESSFDPGERLQAPGSLWFSSPGPKVHVNYCHHLASVVCKLFTFQASSPKPLGPLETNLPGMFAGWSSTKLLFFVPVGYSTWLPGPIICSDWLKFQRSSSLKLMN